MTLNSNLSDIVTIVLLDAADKKIRSILVKIPKSHWWEVSHVNKAAEAIFGMPVRVVRCLVGDTNEESCTERTYALEAVADNLNFINQNESIQNLDSELTGDSAIALQELLYARRNPINSRLMSCEPWIERGWQHKIQSFVYKSLSNVKIKSTTWTQLRCWSRSCVYEIRFEETGYIFKACPPAYGVEPALTKYLSQKYPKLLAEVKAAETTEGCFLLSVAFSGREVAIGDIESFKAAVYGLAEIQVAEANEVSKLSYLGVVIKDYQGLLDSILALLNDDSVLMIEKNGGLTLEEFNKFKESKELLISAISRLQAIGVPLSIEHGDFRTANILCESNHSCRIIDWSEAAISHPFFSLAQLLDEEDHAQDPLTAIQIKNEIALAYFDPWLNSGFTKTQLDEAFYFARLLMPIAKAIERREHLIPSLADASSWRFSVSYWVRRFLLRLESQN